MKSLEGKRVLVYGMGTSGQAACKLLHEKGACVSFYDDEERFSNFYSCEKNPTTKCYDMVVVSPGIKVIGNEIISHFLLNKTMVISELDLGYIFSCGKIVGITGTNGKTTTTSLVGEILKAAGRKTFVCGNIGLPISSIALNTSKDSIIVCEVSNFQLELSQKFSADISVILNLAPDHIDRHGSYEEYIRVKKKIINNKALILNLDDDKVKGLRISKKNIYFSLRPLKKGIYLKNNAIFYNRTRIMPLSEISLVGDKNLLNIMAAIGVAMKLKVKPKVIRSVVSKFQPPKHRLQFLGKLSSGAVVIDDSKATNISSVEMALESLYGREIILLMGGQNKDCDFEPFFEKRFSLVKLVCFGQAGKYLASCAKRAGYNPEVFATMKEGCEYAKSIAGAGQVVLLSPACASFDEFSSYAVRGEIFKEVMFEEEI